jgi:hypothetical protein
MWLCGYSDEATAGDCWRLLPLSNKDGDNGMIYGPFKDIGVWRTRHCNELYRLYDKLDTVRMIKMGRLMWLVQFFRLEELDPCRKLTFLNQKALDA